MGNVIAFKKLKNGTTTVTGLTEGDIRLLQRAIDEGSFMGGDRGGDVSSALLRFGAALRVMIGYTHVEIVGCTSDASMLYDEIAS